MAAAQNALQARERMAVQQGDSASPEHTPPRGPDAPHATSGTVTDTAPRTGLFGIFGGMFSRTNARGGAVTPPSRGHESDDDDDMSHDDSQGDGESPASPGLMVDFEHRGGSPGDENGGAMHGDGAMGSPLGVNTFGVDVARGVSDDEDGDRDAMGTPRGGGHDEASPPVLSDSTPRLGLLMGAAGGGPRLSLGGACFCIYYSCSAAFLEASAACWNTVLVFLDAFTNLCTCCEHVLCPWSCRTAALRGLKCACVQGCCSIASHSVIAISTLLLLLCVCVQMQAAPSRRRSKRLRRSSSISEPVTIGTISQ